MPEVVVATLNVSFSDATTGAGGSLKLEIDDREDGFNNGETSFKPGDTPVFFLFQGKKVELLFNTPKTTSGQVSPFSPSSGLKDIDEYITFSNSSTGTLGYPPEGTVSLEWAGKAYQLQGTTISEIRPPVENDDDALTVEGNRSMIGLLHAVYQSRGSLFQLNSADLPEVMLLSVGRTVQI